MQRPAPSPLCRDPPLGLGPAPFYLSDNIPDLHPSLTPSICPGEQVNLVLTKGCTASEDQEAKVTEHRTGPGLSVTSYTRVCRGKNFCNDLSTTTPLWAPPPVAGAKKSIYTIHFAYSPFPESSQPALPSHSPRPTAHRPSSPCPALLRSFDSLRPTLIPNFPG